MALIRRCRELVLIALGGLVGCGGLPADTPPQKPSAEAHPAAAPAPQLATTWTIRDHILAPHTSMTEADAASMHGRTVTIETSGYTSPWHGACDDAGHQRRTRALADVTTDLRIPERGRAAALRFGLAEDLVEYKLTCNDRSRRAPSLTIFVADTRAMTCFGGVCYLLQGTGSS